MQAVSNPMASDCDYSETSIPALITIIIIITMLIMLLSYRNYERSVLIQN